MNGTRPKTLSAAIVAALENQTITGSEMQETLHQADDPFSPLIGSRNCTSGAFVVLMDWSTTGLNTVSPSGGIVQHMVRYTVTIQAAIGISGFNLDKVTTDLHVWQAAIKDLVDAALNPSTGTNYKVDGVRAGRLVRSSGGDHLVAEVIYTIGAFWSRT